MDCTDDIFIVALDIVWKELLPWYTGLQNESTNQESTDQFYLTNQ